MYLRMELASRTLTSQSGLRSAQLSRHFRTMKGAESCPWSQQLQMTRFITTGCFYRYDGSRLKQPWREVKRHRNPPLMFPGTD